MLDPRIVLVDLSEDCGLVVDYVRPRITTVILTCLQRTTQFPVECKPPRLHLPMQRSLLCLYQVASSQLIADFRMPRFDVVKAVLTGCMGIYCLSWSYGRACHPIRRGTGNSCGSFGYSLSTFKKCLQIIANNLGLECHAIMEIAAIPQAIKVI